MASLADVLKGVQETNQLLTEDLKAQERVQTLLQNNADIAAAARMDALQDSKKTKATVKGGSGTGRPKSFMGGLKAGMFGGGLEGWAVSLIGSLFAVGGALFGAVTGAFGLALGTLVLPAATIALIAAFGTGIITKLLEGLDPRNVVLDKETKTAFASDVVKAMVVGIGLAIFSKPLGLAAFLGGIVVAAFKAGMTEDQKANFQKDILAGMGEKFGITFSKENMMQIGAIIGGLVGFKMIKGLITSAIFGGPTKPGQTPRNTGRIMRFIRAGFALKFAGGMILTSMGEAIGDAIGKITGSETLGDLITGGVTGAGLALLLGLGPAGILTAAIVGVAFTAVKALSNYLNARKQRFIDEALEGIDKALVGMPLNATPREMRQFFNSMTPQGFSKLKNDAEIAAANSDVMNPNALTATKKVSEAFALANEPFGQGGIYAMRTANAKLALGEKFGIQDALRMIMSNSLKNQYFGSGPLNQDQANTILNAMTTIAANDNMPSALQGNLRDFLASSDNRAQLIQLLMEAQSSPMFEDVGRNSGSQNFTTVGDTSNSVNNFFAPAAKPLTVDTNHRIEWMGYGPPNLQHYY